MLTHAIAFILLNLMLLPPPATVPADEQPQLDKAANDALLEVLDEERHSKAVYQAILDQRRPVPPFGMILRQERRHETTLVDELKRLGIAAPADPWSDEQLDVPSDEDKARELGIQLENQTIAAYDKAITAVSDKALKRTLRQLRSESQHHLRMFEMACGDGAGRGAGPGPGGAVGRGRGGNRR